MRLCANARAPRQGCSGAVEAMALLLLLLLGLSQAQSVPQQTACASSTPQSLKQPQYQNTTQEDTGVGFMAALVQSFLHTVQPNPFPKDLILQLVRQYNFSEDLIRDVLLYEVGFLVCLAIGILYIVLMPIVGLFLACCRCCGNCGGKMYQKQTSSTHCHRRALYWSAFVTTGIILAGNVCMFKSNEALRVSVDQSPVELHNSLDNIHTFLTSAPQQIDSVVNESYKTVEKVTGNLHDIGPQLGEEIQKQFRGTLDPALNSVKLLDRETVDLSDRLKKLNSSLEELQSSMDLLQANVTAVKTRINQTISKPACSGCENVKPELDKITVDTSISVPELNEFQSAVDEVVKSNLNSRISEVEDYFQSIPQTVTDETKDIVQDSIQVLGNMKTQISQVTSDISLTSVFQNVLGQLGTAQMEINRVLPQVQKAENIRWAVCVVLCCVVLLVVVCYFLGLVLGPLGLSPKSDPTKRSYTANCGGTFLMMGAGFSLLFAWLFMIAVLILFLLGGNVYTLVCQPWNNGQLLEFIDTPGLIPGLDIGPSLGLKTNLNLTSIYRDCEKNQPLWTTLHLHELVDLDDLLNVSKYTEEIEKNFENAVISLSSVTLLSTEVKTKLRSVSSKAEDFDPTPVTQQINDFTRISLNSTADQLDTLADTQSDGDIQRELRGQARDLRQIQANIELTIIPQLESLNSTIKGFQPTAEKINGTVGEVLSTVGAAQDFLNTNTTQIVKTESRKFLDCQLDYFILYADWAKHTITQQVGRCGPVAGAVDSVEIVLCAYMVESLNAFWFSLGWCMIFFVPGIIFSIKLAKYYRRMKYTDVYDNHAAVNHIPRAHTKFT
ncbi:prominin-2 [Salarias fasciatus]|uniref:Prominin-1-A-like n=1 Tax=Salarias fasciatus TaxID=181472 RepID=A0A672G400_SALFA|nr:prominin-1-A-like [Salarias fasciatus]